ncbi:MAG: 16S rRNA processing protein RimM [Bacteroidetes bacterium]|nr:16S rRNA processing protein RimM [Bacteroidota bacterium]
MKTDAQRQPLRAVAQIRKIFGVRGEMKIESYARTAEEFEQLDGLFLGTGEHDAVPCTIESVKMRGSEIYLKLTGVDDKTAADPLRGLYLMVEESRKKKLPEDRFYIDDLLGCSVKDEHGRLYGMIGAIDDYPAHRIYTVRTKKGPVMLPAVREFIVRVDMDARCVIIRPPDGLFDGEML